MMRPLSALIRLILVSIFAAAAVFIHAEEPGRLIKRGRAGIGMSYDVAVEDQTAYVVNNRGLVILDIQNPDRPKKLGDLRNLWPSFCVEISGTYAYVGGEGGLAVIDISDPKRPREVGQLLKAETVNTVKVLDDIAYVVNSANTLKILAIDAPELPQEIGEFSDGGRYYYHCLGIRDDFLYLADQEQGLELIDISDPRSPKKMGTVPGTQGAGSVFVKGDILIMNFFERSAAFYDVAEPGSPLLQSTEFDEENVMRVMCLSSDYLIVKLEENRVSAFDISRPRRPLLHASRSLPKSTAVHGAAVKGDFVYFTGKGMSIFEIQ